MNFDDAIEEASEISVLAEELNAHLECAETCENAADLHANLAEALKTARDLVKDLTALCARTINDDEEG